MTKQDSKCDHSNNATHSNQNVNDTKETDPVCGMSVDKNKHKPAHVHKGRPIIFVQKIVMINLRPILNFIYLVRTN